MERMRATLNDLSTRLCVMSVLTGRAADELAKGRNPTVDLGQVLQHLERVDGDLAAMGSDLQVLRGGSPLCCGQPTTYVITGSDGKAYACRKCGRSIVVPGGAAPAPLPMTRCGWDE